jgi:hypothetical protein
MKAFGYLARRRRLSRRRRAAGAPGKYNWEDVLGDYAGVTDARYMSFSEIDRWRAVPFDMPPPPERGVVMQRVRQLVEGLDGALDEGTASVLDRYIEAWVGRWIATVETEYADHCGVIELFRCQAAEWMRETTIKLEHARAELDQVRNDYQAVAARLRSDAFAEFDADGDDDGDDDEPDMADPEDEDETETNGDADGDESSG